MESIKSEIRDEIREINLAYLLLAQQIIKHDPVQAAFRLGLDDSIVSILASMTKAQVISLASTPMLLCQFRFAEHHVWDLISKHDKEPKVAGLHSTLLKACEETTGFELS